MSFFEIRKYGLLFSRLCEGVIGNAIDTGDKVSAINFDTRLLILLQTEKGVFALLALLFCALLGYFLGSLNFAVILSRVFHHDDVRKYGSKNAGATNMTRTYGKKWGIATFVCDGLKAAVAVIVSTLLMGEGGAYIAALFAVLGHIFPVYYKFQGGKGVAVAAISIFCLNPLVFAILLVIFLLIVSTSRYISLGSIVCAFFYPMVLNAFSSDKGIISTVVSVLLAVIIIVMHRSNIKRLMNRTENKIGAKKK